ncbi:MAG: hypothetical protein HOL99_02290, partial [Halieaceae bacterium]|nr:hypothetical protein [Halieaceae bacterium]
MPLNLYSSQMMFLWPDYWNFYDVFRKQPYARIYRVSSCTDYFRRPDCWAEDQVVEANAANDFLGWTFGATPDVSQAGEAPVTGISDSLGGSASLNFT